MAVLDPDRERRHLAQAEQHIAEVKAHIARQREFIEELCRDGHETNTAEIDASRLGNEPSRL
jgi:hypothetical protein